MRLLHSFILLLAVGLMACSTANSSEPVVLEQGTATVQLQPTNERYNLVAHHMLRGQKPIELDDSGKAELEVDGLVQIDFFMQQAALSFFALPGESIHLKIEEGAPVVESSSADYDQYLIEKSSLLTQSLTDMQERMKAPSADFIKRENHYADQFEDLLDGYAAKLSPVRVAGEKAANRLLKATALAQYPNYFQYFNNGQQPENDFSDELMALLVPADENAIVLPSQVQMVSEQAINTEFNAMMAAGEQITADNYVEKQLQVVSEKIENPEMRAIALAKKLVEVIEFDMAQAKEAFDASKADIPAEYQTQISAIFEEWSPLLPGNQAPDFNTVDMEGNEVKLSDLRGKYVYIDVWATWCGPCIQEIPHLKELDEEYKYDEIVFLNVSIDDTKEPWKKMVQEEELKGMQVYIDGAWNSSLVKDYKIAGIPRFMLVDPEGKIITVQAARPSGSIRETLDELLKG